MDTTKMEALSSSTSQLKEKLFNINNCEQKEEIIIEHIKNVERVKCIVDDFPPGLDWFNTSKPLSSSHLEGKIVVLDFFTYCCINCLHIIPHLRELEESFSVSDGLVVIGVHSAKFNNEKDSKNILLALKRYNVSHPVVNDKDCFLWNKLEISCWPTLLILGPQRQPLFVLVGEGHRNELLLFVKVALKYYKNSILSHDLPLLNCDKIVTSSLLSFPSKVTRWKNLLAISDSGNHRILIIDTDGHIQFTIGGKTPGFKDGSFETAQFNSPQGLTFYNSNTIYIADTENHAIRLANLNTKLVETVVGNGNQGTDYVGGKTGTLQEISSPWDVCIVPCSDVELEIVDCKANKGIVKASLPLSSPETCSSKVTSSSPPPPPPPPLPPFATSKTSLPPSPPPPLAQPILSQTAPLSIPPPPSYSALTSTSNIAPPPPPPPLLSQSTNSFSSVKKSLSKVLLIAAAGTHQIWAYFFESGIWWKGKTYNKNVCLAIAGSGKEENRNNRYPMMASFAQPSGLTYSEELKSVFIADSESSSIRKLILKNGSVVHVVGGSRSPDNLFSYGDVDGKAYEAKLQHPLGVTWSKKQNCLYVCDTYNHKLKKIDSNGNCISISDQFSEPSGCCLNETEDILFVADTNNNCLKMVHLTDFTVKQLDIKETTKQPTMTEETSSKDVCEVETWLSKSGGNLHLKINFLPVHDKDIHGKWTLNVDNSMIKADKEKGKLNKNFLELPLVVLPSEMDTVVNLFFNVVLCGSETCNYKKTFFRVLVRRSDIADKCVVCHLTKSI